MAGTDWSSCPVSEGLTEEGEILNIQNIKQKKKKEKQKGRQEIDSRCSDQGSP